MCTHESLQVLYRVEINFAFLQQNQLTVVCVGVVNTCNCIVQKCATSHFDGQKTPVMKSLKSSNTWCGLFRPGCMEEIQLSTLRLLISIIKWKRSSLIQLKSNFYALEYVSHHQGDTFCPDDDRTICLKHSQKVSLILSRYQRMLSPFLLELTEKPPLLLYMFNAYTIIKMALLTQCPPPATSTYVMLLYSTVYPATWPSNAGEGRVVICRAQKRNYQQQFG